MKNIQNFVIVFTFVCLWLSVFLESKTEQYMACVLIFSIGILHGANDIKIIKNTYKDRAISFYKSLFLYITTVLLTASLFYFIPKISLLIFIIISSYHFGEQQFHDNNIKKVTFEKLLYFGYGSFIIALLLFTNIDEARVIINKITNSTVTNDFFGCLLVITAILFVIPFLLVIKSLNNAVRELFNLLVLFVVFKTASLLWAFAIYFVLWHAIPSLSSQIQFLYKTVTKRSVFQYLKSSFFYWLASVFGLFVFYDLFIENEDMFFATFFAFLAAITFPHVIVMSRIFRD